MNELISTATEIQKYKKPTDWKRKPKKDQESFVTNIVETHCMDDINDSFNTHITYRELYEYLFGINIYSYNGYMDVDVIDITEVGVNEVEALLDNVIIKGHMVGFASVATYTYGIPGLTEESDPDLLETNLVQLKISYSLALNSELEYEDFEVENIEMTHKALNLS
ncbi:hypothetical protein [Halobacillus sp. BBL2006]|uniref:hypothetical protein n=1 Tax=Halobacillus sp. BBL2006 TaxID=1543706 RepID=UPI0005421511|nr:hypothetical protein [Halobacillus sp. BBL2006]KHE72950.1 hypothetical protein LD39_01880 [Halobacillus sp. BBL2006]